MIDNVVELYPDKSGYITSQRDGKTFIDGVYNDELVAFELDGEVFIGEKGSDDVKNPVVMEKEDLNRFCVMWLAINDPSVLSTDQQE